MTNLVIAIDGSSGSGKSSTSKKLATKLGIAYLDTGSMYRAFTWFCLTHNFAANNAENIAEAIDGFKLEVKADPLNFQVLVNATDITSLLHDTEISGQVSAFAAVSSVRKYLISLMRNIIKNHERIVVEGRDIASVVAPDAQVKVLLKADPQLRIQRRAKQFSLANTDLVSEQVIGRDQQDSQVNDFFNPADDVVLIDNSSMTLDEVVDEIISLVPAGLR